MKLITTLLGTLSAVCLGLLLLVVLLVIFKLGTWAPELSEFLLAWTVMLGGALAYAEHAHLGLDILIEKFDAPTKKLSMLISHLLVLAFALVVMVYGGYQLTMERFDMGQLLPSMNISKGWLYLAVPISGCFVTLTALLNVRKIVTSTDKPASNIS